MFDSDIPDLRTALEECDKCPHVRSYKQEWHVLFKKNKQIIDIKAALNKLKEVNWLYKKLM